MWNELTQPWIESTQSDHVERTAQQLGVAAVCPVPDAQGAARAIVRLLTSSNTLSRQGQAAWSVIAAGPPAADRPTQVLLYVRHHQRPVAETPGIAIGLELDGRSYTATLLGSQPARRHRPTYGPSDQTPVKPAAPSPSPSEGWVPIDLATSAGWNTLLDMLRAKGWASNPPASETRIAATETRLGTRLPPSLRAFYGVTNGCDGFGDWIAGIPAVEDLQWANDPHDWLADVVAESDGDEAYAQLWRSLVVSLDSDMAVLYADPETIDHGEWACIDYQVDDGGFRPMPSFGAQLARHIGQALQ